MSTDPRLDLISSGEPGDAHLFDRKGGDGVRKPRRRFQLLAFGEGKGKSRTERVSGTGRIDYALGREPGNQDLPPAA
jgi:hypothetical protein